MKNTTFLDALQDADWNLLIQTAAEIPSEEPEFTAMMVVMGLIAWAVKKKKKKKKKKK